jgi:hypothetical protein
MILTPSHLQLHGVTPRFFQEKNLKLISIRLCVRQLMETGGCFVAECTTTVYKMRLKNQQPLKIKGQRWAIFYQVSILFVMID